MRGPIKMGVVVAAGGVLLAALLIVQLRHGFSARDEPTAIEAFVARRLRHLAVPTTAREEPNPINLTAEVLTDARAHFADHCAQCHGNDGKGMTELGQNMYPKAPDMTLSRTQSLSDGELFYIIHNGIRLTGMPAWGEGSPEEDRESWKLVHFIRRLPEITPEELAEMRTMNPRTRREFEAEEEMRRFLEGEDPPPPPTGHKH